MPLAPLPLNSPVLIVPVDDFKTAYLAAQWLPKTETIRIPQLAVLFDKGKKQGFIDRLKDTKADSEEYKTLLAEYQAYQEHLNQRCTFEVRGLSAPELSKIKVAKARLGSVEAALKAVSNSTGMMARSEAIRAVLDLDGNADAELASRLEAVCLGTVSPEIDMDLAVVIAQHHGAVLWNLADKIFELTDQGSVLEKPKTSGNTNPA